jgi:hypothetical protein
MGEIEEFIGIQIIALAFFVFVPFLIVLWSYSGLLEIFGILPSIVILISIFVGLPVGIYCYFDKKKSREKIEMREIEDKILSKSLKKSKKK